MPHRKLRDFRLRVLSMVQNGKLPVEKLIPLGIPVDFAALHSRELAKPKEGCLSKCLIHSSKKSGKEKREKFLVTGASDVLRNLKLIFTDTKLKELLPPTRNSPRFVHIYALLSIYTHQKFLACSPLALV